MLKNKKYYSLSGSNIPLLQEIILEGVSSKDALESYLNKKVIYLKSDFDLNNVNKYYCLREGNEKGHIYKDRRKRKYYTI